MEPFTIESTLTQTRLSLHGTLGIEQARALKDALQAALKPGLELSLNASALTRCDAAILQTLLSATRFAGSATLTASSAAWESALARFGMTDPFTRPS